MVKQNPIQTSPETPVHPPTQGPAEPESAPVRIHSDYFGMPTIEDVERQNDESAQQHNLDTPRMLLSLARQREYLAVGLEELMRRTVCTQQLIEPEVYKAFVALAAVQKSLAQTCEQVQRGRPITTGALAQRLINSAFGAGHGGKREGSGRKPKSDDNELTGEN